MFFLVRLCGSYFWQNPVVDSDMVMNQNLILACLNEGGRGVYEGYGSLLPQKAKNSFSSYTRKKSAIGILLIKMADYSFINTERKSPRKTSFETQCEKVSDELSNPYDFSKIIIQACSKLPLDTQQLLLFEIIKGMKRYTGRT
jgi:hypothetical protein